MLYYLILFFLLVLSAHYDINGKKLYRDQWYTVVMIFLILLAGLRYRLGEDTINYTYMYYHDTPDVYDINFDLLLNSGQPPLWIILCSIIKTIGGKFFVVQLFAATIVNTLILKYFKKHSPYPFACVAFFFFWRYLYYNMVLMKAAVALSIILFANDYFLDRKYLKGFLLILIATGFHQSSVLMVIVPFLTFLRFNKVGIIILVCTYFVGAFLQSKLGDVFELFEFSEGVSGKLDNYLDSEFMTQVHNLNFFIVKFFPLLIYPIISIIYIKQVNKESHILRLEPFLMLGLIFQVMQFNIHISYRFVYIFLPYFMIYIVQFFIDFSRNSLKLKNFLAYVRTVAICLPLIASLAFYHPLTYISFYPYSSVIERSIDQGREQYYAGFVVRYYLNKEEY